MKNVTLTIDGKKITVPDNYTIIQAADKLGIHIPALCYDSNLEVVSSCRLCVVEIEGNLKLQTSCSTLVAEDMTVYTESEKVIKIRKDLLRLMLDNHPNDCLVCEKAGDCLLQKYAYRYDMSFREHDGARRKNIVDTSSPFILRNESKCILCGKCVRVCSQVSERAVLSFAERGFDTRIVADASFTLEESSCVSCNRCVTVCPTGALIDARNIGKGRSWELEKEDIKCKACDYGCDFEVLKKGNRRVAVKAKAPSVGRPLCLKGRLTTELLNVDQPKPPYVKQDGKFKEADWKTALGLGDLIKKLED